MQCQGEDGQRRGVFECRVSRARGNQEKSMPFSKSSISPAGSIYRPLLLSPSGTSSLNVSFPWVERTLPRPHPSPSSSGSRHWPAQQKQHAPSSSAQWLLVHTPSAVFGTIVSYSSAAPGPRTVTERKNEEVAHTGGANAIPSRLYECQGRVVCPIVLPHEVSNYDCGRDCDTSWHVSDRSTRAAEIGEMRTHLDNVPIRSLLVL